ncbi:hypothetical protein BC829DRAFT_432835, partial [Chytridium lagenaria]
MTAFFFVNALLPTILYMSFLSAVKRKRPTTEFECFTSLLKLLRIKVLDEYNTAKRLFHILQSSVLFIGPSPSLDSPHLNGERTWRKDTSWRIISEVVGRRMPFKTKSAESEDASLTFRDPVGVIPLGHVGDSVPNGDVDDSYGKYGKELLKMLLNVTKLTGNLDRELILEIALTYVRLELIQDAYTFMERYVTSPPYNDDSVLLGYTGLISYLLWRKEIIQGKREEIDGSKNLNSVHYRNAMQHFNLSFEKNGGQHHDIFILYLLKLVLASDQVERAKEILERFHRECPENPNACLYLFVFTFFTHGATSECIQLASQYVQLDPSADPDFFLKPLVEKVRIAFKGE